MQDDLTSISQRCSEWVNAINVGSLDHYIQLLTPDAVWIPSGQPSLRGKETIRQWLASSFATFRYQFTLSEDHIRVSGDWAVERVSFTSILQSNRGGEPTHFAGRHLVVWRREQDGCWYIERCIDDNNRMSERAVHSRLGTDQNYLGQ